MFALIVKPKQTQAVKAIQNQSYKLICLNDNIRIRNYEQVMKNNQDAFESILSEKSSLEKLQKLIAF
jgi:hypothetical protein